MDESLRLLLLVAHPDDAEFRAGGLMTKCRAAGHTVKIISLTNGDAGHHELPRADLAQRRKIEAQAAAAILDLEYEIWDHHDGELEPTLDLRWQVIRAIREFGPNLVLCHRPDDYHPDHRAVGHVVRDACYLITVPTIVPETPPLSCDPVVGFLYDPFTRPTPFLPDVLLDISNELDTVFSLLSCHESQMFEWLPHNHGLTESVPTDVAGRRALLRQFYESHVSVIANQFRDRLIDQFGPKHGKTLRHVEAFEISEYAAPLTETNQKRLFAFAP